MYEQDHQKEQHEREMIIAGKRLEYLVTLVQRRFREASAENKKRYGEWVGRVWW